MAQPCNYFFALFPSLCIVFGVLDKRQLKYSLSNEEAILSAEMMGMKVYPKENGWRGILLNRIISFDGAASFYVKITSHVFSGSCNAVVDL